jgi:uridine kinase
MNAFPKVKIICSAIDEKLDDKYHILPGMGNFAERYFGA